MADFPPPFTSVEEAPHASKDPLNFLLLFLGCKGAPSENGTGEWKIRLFFLDQKHFVASVVFYAPARSEELKRQVRKTCLTLRRGRVYVVSKTQFNYSEDALPNELIYDDSCTTFELVKFPKGRSLKLSVQRFPFPITPMQDLREVGVGSRVTVMGVIERTIFNERSFGWLVVCPEQREGIKCQLEGLSFKDSHIFQNGTRQPPSDGEAFIFVNARVEAHETGIKLLIMEKGQSFMLKNDARVRRLLGKWEEAKIDRRYLGYYTFGTVDGPVTFSEMRGILLNPLSVVNRYLEVQALLKGFGEEDVDSVAMHFVMSTENDDLEFLAWCPFYVIDYIGSYGETTVNDVVKFIGGWFSLILSVHHGHCPWRLYIEDMCAELGSLSIKGADCS